jgi:glucose/arabinose dehydrogenase
LPAATLACDAGDGGITRPSGVCAIIVADGMGLIRHAAVRPDGDVYVAIRRAQDGSDNGGVLALRDTDGDGEADRKERFGTIGGTGIAWYQGGLYLAAEDRILRYTFSGGKLLPSGTPRP